MYRDLFGWASRGTWMLCDLLPAHGEDALGRKTPLTNPCRKASGRNFSIGRKNRASTELFLYLKVSQLILALSTQSCFRTWSRSSLEVLVKITYAGYCGESWIWGIQIKCLFLVPYRRCCEWWEFSLKLKLIHLLPSIQFILMSFLLIVAWSNIETAFVDEFLRKPGAICNFGTSDVSFVVTQPILWFLMVSDFAKASHNLQLLDLQDAFCLAGAGRGHLMIIFRGKHCTRAQIVRLETRKK